MTQESMGWVRRLLISFRDNKLRWMVVFGLVGMVFIALSEWLPHGNKTATTDLAATVPVSSVEQALEERVASLIRRVDGVGDCHVMVTLENGSRYVYASEQSFSGATENRTGSDKTIVVQTDTGPVGLLITEVQPTIKGVAVVCAGGGDEAVCAQVRGLVCAALNISSGRVFVAKQQ